MAADDRVLWLHNAHTPCAGNACAAPDLRGDAGELARVLQALRAVPDAMHGGNIVDAQQVLALHLMDGEAVLRLNFAAHCGAGRLMVEEAFQVLRQTLPDTDVYALPAT
jgi:hypothetical protein